MTSPHPGFKIGTFFKKAGRLWALGWHTGWDYLTPTGTKAYAGADGVVRSAGWAGAYGNQVVIESTIGGRTVRHSRNHLSKISVKTGQRVSWNTVVGKTGATGNVTGPHDHVECRVFPFTYSAGTFISPQALHDWQPPKKVVPRPAWATLRRKTPPPRWFRSAFQNLGLMNDHGYANARTNLPKIVRDVAELRPDVFQVVELKGEWRDYFDGLMRGIGYKRGLGGSDGRYNYFPQSVTVKAGGTFDLQPRFEGDDKQAAWDVATLNGHDAIVVTGHLEHEDGADDERVGQALSQIKQAEAIADKRGLSRTRILHGTDTNSATWVRQKAFNERHYADAAEVAWRFTSWLLATFKGWGKNKPQDGPRIDMFAAHRARPFLFYGTRVRNAGTERDHLMIVADVGIITA